MFNTSPAWRWLSCTLALAASFAVAPTHAATPQATVRNIVLVHGAFADGSSWSPVIKLLQRKGYHVTAVQNPLTSLADDVAATRRVLDRQKGGVILVGHSWAGTVVTEAGNADNVQGLVYLSALVPDSGESTADLLTRLAAPMEGFTPDKDGLLWLDDPVAYRQVMAGDVPAPQAALLAATQQPMAARAFGDKVNTAAWRSKPSWYLLTENDKALPPRVQQALAQAIGATTVSIKSSHMSLVSHPDAVVALIERAARSVGP
ncbi:pimeloyl-ACP methyl ester carboxylesterase [Rhodoferax ferrireducens]|uniref:Pimeloyl-ACP methyl ester carboxylesterase n=1 Tax=Rhodoferax ferrireducens TaxID=192843 RepID=A0ABU2C538_9BURK|nr:alpha/beta hydrolase [Rhodoferax ferrireducens]MDR7376451.1 pimeloyl-ACP methyl ester carboxylesterase [Rhodoferax ferrireducens]